MSLLPSFTIELEQPTVDLLTQYLKVCRAEGTTPEDAISDIVADELSEMSKDGDLDN